MVDLSISSLMQGHPCELKFFHRMDRLGRRKQIKVGWDNFKIRFIATEKVTKFRFCLGKQFTILERSRIYTLGIIEAKGELKVSSNCNIL